MIDSLFLSLTPGEQFKSREWLRRPGKENGKGQRKGNGRERKGGTSWVTSFVNTYRQPMAWRNQQSESQQRQEHGRTGHDFTYKSGRCLEHRGHVVQCIFLKAYTSHETTRRGHPSLYSHPFHCSPHSLCEFLAIPRLECRLWC